MPPNEIVIPPTIEDAAKRLGDLDRLFTATGWELAAILATFVEPGAGQGTSARSSRSRVSATEFVSTYRIRGLRSKDTVVRYVDIWTEHVGSRPKPGETVKLPTTPWPPQAANLGSRTSTDPEKAVEQVIARHGAAAERIVVKRMARKDPASVAAAIMDAGTGASDQAFHELKLRRAGVDTSKANQKAANAFAHAQTEPIRRAVASTYVALCVQALKEATEDLQKAQEDGTLNNEAMAQISEAHEAFQFALTEARFAVS